MSAVVTDETVINNTIKCLSPVCKRVVKQGGRRSQRKGEGVVIIDRNLVLKNMGSQSFQRNYVRKQSMDRTWKKG